MPRSSPAYMNLVSKGHPTLVPPKAGDSLPLSGLPTSHCRSHCPETLLPLPQKQLLNWAGNKSFNRSGPSSIFKTIPRSPITSSITMTMIIPAPSRCEVLTRDQDYAKPPGNPLREVLQMKKSSLKKLADKEEEKIKDTLPTTTRGGGGAHFFNWVPHLHFILFFPFWKLSSVSHLPQL